MCGIVGASAQRDVVPILLEGFRRLEYRGYDSAGMALSRTAASSARASARWPHWRKDGLAQNPWHARHRAYALGDARRAEREERASAYFKRRVAVVHNGIIENHETLRKRLRDAGYRFESDTDTEVVAHRIHSYRRTSATLAEAVRRPWPNSQAPMPLVVISDPDTLVAPAGLSAGDRRGHRRTLRRLRRDRIAAGHAPLPVSGGRRRRHAHPRLSSRSRRRRSVERPVKTSELTPMPPRTATIGTSC